MSRNYSNPHSRVPKLQSLSKNVMSVHQQARDIEKLCSSQERQIHALRDQLLTLQRLIMRDVILESTIGSELSDLLCRIKECGSKSRNLQVHSWGVSQEHCPLIWSGGSPQYQRITCIFPSSVLVLDGRQTYWSNHQIGGTWFGWMTVACSSNSDIDLMQAGRKKMS
jgi:hypothetical protein